MKQEKLQLTTGGKKENRRDLDFYPTPAECTIALMDFLKLKPCSIWEPACGNGAISEVLKSYGHTVHSTDLFSYGYGLDGTDFLTSNTGWDWDAIITNPPFNLSTAFIEKALKEAPIVAMLLKSQYWHSKSRYDLFMNNQPAYVLPLTWRPNFAPEKGSAPTMEVHWTVWMQGDRITKYIPLNKPVFKLPRYEAKGSVGKKNINTNVLLFNEDNEQVLHKAGVSRRSAGVEVELYYCRLELAANIEAYRRRKLPHLPLRIERGRQKLIELLKLKHYGG